MNRFSCVLFGTLALLLAVQLDSKVEAQALGTPHVRYDIHGNVLLTGNTALTCQPGSTNGATTCAQAQSNRALSQRDNDFPMVAIDADNANGVGGAATTTQSSAASLSLPATGSVRWAALYWMCISTSATRNRVSFQAPGAAGYTTVTASTTFTTANSDGYMGFADVTSTVRTAGGGTYWVGNMQCDTGANMWGGWNLVVVYEDVTEPLRDIVVWDGLVRYQNGGGNPPVIDLTLTGFVTPVNPAVPIITDIGYFVGDGDLGQNDSVRLTSGTGPGALVTNLADPVSGSTTDVGNSTISTPFTPTQTMIPSYANTLGYDLDVFRTTDRLNHNSQSAAIRLSGSANDVLFTGVITFSTNIFAPDLVSTKTAVDLNGGQLLPGDTLEYTINVTNQALDASVNTLLVDDLPAFTSLAGTVDAIRLDGANLTAVADADRGAYSMAQNRVTVSLGSLPSFRVAPGESHEIKIKVVLAGNIPNGTLLSNQASFTYNGETLGNSVAYNSLTDGSAAAGSNPTDTSVTSPASITFTDVAMLTGDVDMQGDLDPGDTVTYTITVANAAGAASATNVHATDALDTTRLELVSLTTSRGSVASMMPSSLDVNIGTLAGGESAIITLVARIKRPFPVGVTTISDQWTATGSFGAAKLSDDPAVVGAANPTVIGPITASCACFVGNACFASGAADPTNACASCQPGTSQGAFSPVTDGNACGGPGGTCHGGVCCNTCWNGAACVAGPPTCGVVCGDGQRIAGEECDDGDNLGGDGCSATCTVEEGFSCAGALPNVCTQDVAILTPSDGATTTDTTPVLAGTGPAGAMLTVREGASVLCTTTVSVGGTWSCDSTVLALGAHTIVARTTGPGAGDLGLSLPSSFTIAASASCGNGVVGAGETCDDGNPSSGDGCSSACAVEAGYACVGAGPSACTLSVIAITLPANGSQTADTTPDITGTATPGSTVTVLESGATLCTATTNAGGTWSCTSTVLALGAHTIFARSTGPNPGDNGLSINDTFSVVTVVTQVPPTILSPPDGGTVVTRTPTIIGRGESGASITVLEGSVTICTSTVDPSGAWSCVPTSSLSLGQHVILARQVKASVTLDSMPTTFTIDLGAFQTPALVAPPPGSTVADPTPTLSGTATPGSTLEVTENGQPICSAITNASGIWTCTPATALGEGPHVFDLLSTLGAQSATGGPDTIIVDLTAPTIDVTGPVAGSSTSDATPQISGTTEPSATINVYEGTTLLCVAVADGQGTWACSPTTTLSEGPHVVRATATDGAGNVSMPDMTSFVVDTTGPGAPVIVGPSEGAVIGTQTPTIVGTSEPLSEVAITEGATTICVATTNAAGVFTCVPTAPLASGPHTLVATATDPLGNAGGSDTQSFTITLGAISTPTLTGPLTPVSDSTPELTGIADPGVTVTIRDVNGAVVCSDVTDGAGVFVCTPTTPFADGPNALTLVATSGMLTSTPGTATVTVDSTAPVPPTITEPGTAPTPTPTPVIGGTAEPHSTVTVRNGGGTVLCTALTDASGHWACIPTTPLPEGPTPITATATDGAGNESGVATATIIVDTTAPSVTIALPEDGSTIGDTTPTVSGTTEPGATVTVTDSAGFIVCAVTADASGAWSCEVPSELVDGPHTLYATATDVAGNTSAEASTTFVIETEQSPGSLAGGALCATGTGADDGSALALTLVALATLLARRRWASRSK